MEARVLTKRKDGAVLPVRALLGVFAFLAALTLLFASVPTAAADPSASFSGSAHILVVGKTSRGAVVHLSMSDVPYQVGITASSLGLMTMGMTMGGPLASGAISISTSGAHGGGTLGGSTPSQMAFTASPTGGQFQCLMAGFSAGFSFEMDGMTLTILQMDVHGSVAAGTYSAIG